MPISIQRVLVANHVHGQREGNGHASLAKHEMIFVLCLVTGAYLVQDSVTSHEWEAVLFKLLILSHLSNAIFDDIVQLAGLRAGPAGRARRNSE